MDPHLKASHSKRIQIAKENASFLTLKSTANPRKTQNPTWRIFKSKPQALVSTRIVWQEKRDRKSHKLPDTIKSLIIEPVHGGGKISRSMLASAPNRVNFGQGDDARQEACTWPNGSCATEVVVGMNVKSCVHN